MADVMNRARLSSKLPRVEIAERVRHGNYDAKWVLSAGRVLEVELCCSVEDDRVVIAINMKSQV